MWCFEVLTLSSPDLKTDQSGSFLPDQHQDPDPDPDPYKTYF